MTDRGPRRSARLQTVKTRTQGTSSRSSEPPVRKRRKAQDTHDQIVNAEARQSILTKGRKKKGRLWKLPEMPLDLLFEIFELLHHLDLLRLSRTSKALRACLLNPSAVSVWKRARGNVEGVPDCPPNLSEPQYASLLFENMCSFCGRSGVMEVLWSCCVRSCHKCFDKRFIGFEEAHIELPLCKDHELLPYVWDPRPRRYGQLYMKSQVIALSRKFDSLKFQTDIDSLIKETVAANQAMRQHTSACSAWYSKMRVKRCMEIDQIRRDRQNAIRARMEALGWAEDFQKLSWSEKREYSRLPGVHQAKPLTDRMWRNLQGPMIELFTRFRNNRITRERLAVLYERLDILQDLVNDEILSSGPLNFLPSVADLFNLSAFKEIIFRPNEVEVNAASFDLPMSLYWDYASLWVNDAYKLLGSLFSEPAAPDEDLKGISERLRLATTFFRCGQCDHPVPYPHILLHKCMRMSSRRPHDYYEARCFDHIGAAPWLQQGERLTFDTVASKAAEAMVIARGMDPKVATYIDMEAGEEYHVCPYCSNDEVYVAMTWRRAIYHTSSHHRQPDLEPLPWITLPRAYKSEMQAHQDAQNHGILDRMRLMCCMLCRRERMSPSELVRHFVVIHRGALDELDDDDNVFYIHPDVNHNCTPTEARLKVRSAEELANDAGGLLDEELTETGSHPAARTTTDETPHSKEGVESS